MVAKARNAITGSHPEKNKNLLFRNISKIKVASSNMENTTAINISSRLACMFLI